MDKRSLVEAIATENRIYEAEAKEMVEMVINGIISTVRSYGELQIKGFGSFKVKRVEQRRGTNPQTSEEIAIPAHNKVVFRPGLLMKKAIGVNNDE